MNRIQISAYELASKFIGIKERPGDDHHPYIQWALELCGFPDSPDETPWCAAWLWSIAYLLDLPRPGTLPGLARSWLKVGKPVLGPVDKPEVGMDIVVLKRGSGNQPGPENTTAPGHVGFFAGYDTDRVKVLGGNQSDSVSIAAFDENRVLAFRRLA